MESFTHRQHLVLHTLVTSVLVCVAFLFGRDMDRAALSAFQGLACLLELVFIVLHHNNRAIAASNNNIVVLQCFGRGLGMTDAE